MAIHGPIDWKSRAMDMMHRLGIGKGSKPKTADELTPAQLRAERERRAREQRKRG